VAANLASIEFHVPLWRIGDGKELPKDPDLMVFDLDPGPGTTIVIAVGSRNGWPTDSGSRRSLRRRAGPRASSSTEGSAASRARRPTAKRTNSLVDRTRPFRRGRFEHEKGAPHEQVLIDWSQNTPAKTTVAVYSVRARSDPTVSTPVTWEEVEKCARSGNPDDLRFEVNDVLVRVEAIGDLMQELVKG